MEFPGPNFGDKDLRDRVLEFQQAKLQGFTTRQLATLDCLTTRDLKEPTLKNSILPLFGRRNWEKRPHARDFPKKHLYKIGNGHEGFWVAHNPIVWEILRPILQLTSRLLSSSDLLHWYISREHTPPQTYPRS